MYRPEPVDAPRPPLLYSTTWSRCPSIHCRLNTQTMLELVGKRISRQVPTGSHYYHQFLTDGAPYRQLLTWRGQIHTTYQQPGNVSSRGDDTWPHLTCWQINQYMPTRNKQLMESNCVSVTADTAASSVQIDQHFQHRRVISSSLCGDRLLNLGRLLGWPHQPTALLWYQQTKPSAIR